MGGQSLLASMGAGGAAMHRPSSIWDYGRLFFWDGRVQTLEEQVLRPIEDPNEMDLPLEEASSRVGRTVEEIWQALASFVRSILSGNSRYDRFISGDRGSLNDDERKGLEIFRGKGNCNSCHTGPSFSDEQLHNTGIAWRDGRLSDEVVRAREERDLRGSPGAMADCPTRVGAVEKFKTPTLRELSRTAPYMHDGSFDSIEQVIEYYDRGGNPNPGLDPELHPLHLSEAEKRNLEQFLRTLAGNSPL
jgi:cytochrome c peroxidase